MELKKLQNKDHKKIIQYAIQGMHFNTYTNNKFILNSYGKYFWYSELLKATKVITLYHQNELAGVLLANMFNEKKFYKSISKSIYVKFIDHIQNIFFKGNALYDEVNKKMLENYKKENKPDGEIGFLAANPNLKIKGIGTQLLNELKKQEKEKEIYLFTDDKCTYQFYEHRGFDKIAEENIVLDLNTKIPLKCLLYRKKL